MTQPVPIRTPNEREQFCSLPGLSELTPELLDRHRPASSWAIADAGGALTARCSLWTADAPQLPGQRVGAIGHYSATNPDAAARLLELACSQLEAAGCTLAVGPLDGNTWRRYRLLTDRGSEPPFFLEPDNPDDWPAHFSANGFARLANYYSAVNDDVSRVDSPHEAIARRIAEHGISLRQIRLDSFDDELRAIHALSLASFAQNFLYTPIGETEFVEQYRLVQPVVRPELVLMAERDGQLVGFLFAVPDLHQAKRGQPIDTAIIKSMAVHPAHRGSGLGGLLMALGHKAAHLLGYRRAIHALMHSSNASRKISDHTARTIRRYTLFARPLGVAT